MNPYYLLIIVALGWLMSMFANDSMIIEEGQLIAFVPTPVAWYFNLAGMALFVMGILVLNAWCETKLIYLHKPHEDQKTIMEE